MRRADKAASIAIEISAPATILAGDAVHFGIAGPETFGVGMQELEKYGEVFWTFDGRSRWLEDADANEENYDFPRANCAVRTPHRAGTARGPWAVHAFRRPGVHEIKVEVYFGVMRAEARVTVTVLSDEEAGYDDSRTVWCVPDERNLPAPLQAKVDAGAVDPATQIFSELYNVTGDNNAPSPNALFEARRATRGKLVIWDDAVYEIREKARLGGFSSDPGLRVLRRSGDGEAQPIIRRHESYRPTGGGQGGCASSEGGAYWTLDPIGDSGAFTVAMAPVIRADGVRRVLLESPDLLIEKTVEDRLRFVVGPAGALLDETVDFVRPNNVTACIAVSVDADGGLSGGRSVDVWIDGRRVADSVAATPAGLDLTPMTVGADMAGGHPHAYGWRRWIWAHAGAAVDLEPTETHEEGYARFFSMPVGTDKESEITPRTNAPGLAMLGFAPLVRLSLGNLKNARAGVNDGTGGAVTVTGALSDFRTATDALSALLDIEHVDAMVVQGVSFRARTPYDPADPSVWDGVSLDTADYDAGLNAVELSGGNRHVTLVEIDAKGLQQGIDDTGGGSNAHCAAIACTISDWANYGIYFSPQIGGHIVGCDIRQTLAAAIDQRAGASKTLNKAPSFWARRDSQGVLSIAYETNPNYADHGPIRLINSYGSVVNRNVCWSSNGWSDDTFAQPSIRFAMTGNPNMYGVVSENQVIGAFSASPANDKGGYSASRAIVIESNWMDGSQRSRGFGVQNHSNIVSRCNIFHFPDVAPYATNEILAFRSGGVDPVFAEVDSAASSQHFYSNTAVNRFRLNGATWVLTSQAASSEAGASRDAPKPFPEIKSENNVWLDASGAFSDVVERRVDSVDTKLTLDVSATAALADPRSTWDAYYRPGPGNPVLTAATVGRRARFDFFGLDRGAAHSVAGAFSDDAAALPSGWDDLASEPEISYELTAPQVRDGDVLGVDIVFERSVPVTGRPILDPGEIREVFTVDGARVDAGRVLSEGQMLVAKAFYGHPATTRSEVKRPYIVAPRTLTPEWIEPAGAGALNLTGLLSRKSERLMIAGRVRFGPSASDVDAKWTIGGNGLSVGGDYKQRLYMEAPGAEGGNVSNTTGAYLAGGETVSFACFWDSTGLMGGGSGGATMAMLYAVDGGPMRSRTTTAPIAPLDPSELFVNGSWRPAWCAWRSWLFIAEDVAPPTAATWETLFDSRDGHEVRDVGLAPPVRPKILIQGAPGFNAGPFGSNGGWVQAI